jgi:pyridoxine 5'-phosphate synthase PdxJ
VQLDLVVNPKMGTAKILKWVKKLEPNSVGVLCGNSLPLALFKSLGRVQKEVRAVIAPQLKTVEACRRARISILEFDATKKDFLTLEAAARKAVQAGLRVQVGRGLAENSVAQLSALEQGNRSPLFEKIYVGRAWTLLAIEVGAESASRKMKAAAEAP